MVAADPRGGAEERSWHAAALEAAPVGLATFDANLRCLTATPVFVTLLGRRAPGDVVGEDLSALFGATTGARMAAVARTVIATGEPAADEEVRVEGAGSRRWLSAKWFGTGDHTAPVGAFLLDVSDRHAGDEQRAALQRLTSEFAAAVTPEAVADVVIGAVLASVGASGGALYLLDDAGRRLTAVESRYPWVEGEPLIDVALTEDLPVSVALRTRQPVWVHDEKELRTHYPSTLLSHAAGWGAHAALPLQLAGEQFGSIVFSWPTARPFSVDDRTFLEVVAEQCSQAIARASAFSRERSAREHTERVADYVLRLERITGALAVASDPEQVVDRFLDECLAELGANNGAVLVVDSNGSSLQPIAARSEIWEPTPVPLSGHGPLSLAAQTRQTVLLEDLTQIQSMLGDSRAPSTPEQAWAAVPLIAYGDLLGVAALRYDGTRTFDTDDRAFLDRVGRRLGEALERSRLFARQRDAREQAEAAARWLRSVQSLAASLARSATRRDVARALREHLQPATRADFSIVAALSNDRRQLDVLTGTASFAMSTGAIGASVEGAVRDSIMRGRSIELEDPHEVETLFPHLAEQGIVSFALLPIRTGHRVIGVIGMGWSSVGGLSVDTRRLLAIAVSLGGAAFERAAAYDLDHHIAETLQRHMLTTPALDVPGLLWAARYAPGRAELTAGGDWYDVIQLPDGRVALVVGDIVGHGVVAAAAMGQLRSATRALAVREGPVGVLEALDAYVTTTGQGSLSSMAVVVLDPATGAAEFAVAGHPPPMLRERNGTIVLVEEARGPLLGIAPPGSRRSLVRPVAAETTIVLYTDGLIERRGESIDAGIERLGAVIAAAPRQLHPEGLCDQMLEHLASGGAAPDDITVLAVTFQPVARERVQSYPARVDMLRVIRTELRTWLLANDVDPLDAADVVLACDEVCANVFEQRARIAGPDVIELRLRVDADEVVLALTDAGPWLEQTASPSGSDIVGALMHDVRRTVDDAGTMITMRRRRASPS